MPVNVSLVMIAAEAVTAEASTAAVIIIHLIFIACSFAFSFYVIHRTMRRS